MLSRLRILIVLAATLFLVFPASALTLTDIAGRTVKLEGPAKKIILGEGRFLAAIGILDRKDPTARIVGMMGEFKRLDPAGFAQYTKAFPRLKDIPLFGLTSETSISVEKAISLGPDVAIFGVSGHGPSIDSKELIENLEAAGIKIVFIDFRDDPLLNTPKSMEILGKVLGREKEAAEYLTFYRQELARVSDVLAKAKVTKPKVFMENHVGLNGSCCRTVANGMMGRFIDFAGGENIAKAIVPGSHGTINLEYLITSEPDVYIGTAIGTPMGIEKTPKRIVLGVGVSRKVAQASLKRALARPGISGLKAVATKRAHAIWHHYYNTPLHVVAVQAFAKWFHPQLFKDLDPRQTLQTLHSRFQPVPLSGHYTISLD